MDNPPDQAAIQGLVENALGINTFRDENVMATDNVQIEYIIPSSENKDAIVIGDSAFVVMITDWVTSNWWVILIGIILLVLLIVVIRVLSKRNEEEELEDEFELDYASMIEEEEEEKEPIIDLAMQEKMRRNEVVNEKEDMIREQTKENPELAAELIKIWLQDNE